MNPIFRGVLEIDPRELRGAPKTLSLVCDAQSWAQSEQEVRLASDLRVQVEVSAAGATKHLLTVQYQTQRFLTCARSLVEFAHPEAGKLQVLVEPSPGLQAWELFDEEEELFILRYGTTVESFSIAECIRQDILLNEPVRPLASPEAEFNWESAQPQETEAEVDPRWAKLRAWTPENPTSTGD